ncbi:MAG: DNA methyltransferase [Armatimonadota bacterium]
MTTRTEHAEPAVPCHSARSSTRRIDEIIIPSNARAHDETSVRTTAESLQELGQLAPVLVTKDNRLLDGRLRLAAARLLEWEEIEARVIDLDELRTELAGIDANLIRVGLTELERAECLLRRKAIYEALHPEVRYGSSEMMQAVRRGEQDTARQPSFAVNSASCMHCDPRTVQHLVKIATGLSEDVRDQIRATPVADIQSDLDRLSRCTEAEQRRIAGQISSGELTRVPKDAGRVKSWTPPDPDGVLRRVNTILTGRLSGRSDADLSVIPSAIKEIEGARSAWEPPTDEPGELPPPLSLDEIDKLPAGQLEIRWPSGHAVEIVKAGIVIAAVRVRRAARTDQSWVKGSGNSKTADWMGQLNSCSWGCFGRATGLPGCDRPCYADADGRGGCYVEGLACKKRPEFANSHVIENGTTNTIARITLPDDGDARLGDRVPSDWFGDIMTWRESCETGTTDQSISLGTFQHLAESNPDHRFVGICADHFRPSDPMMAWLAALDNVVVGHSVSAWLSSEALEMRFAAIERFLDWGVPTVIWVVTDEGWDNAPVLERAVAMVGPDKVIQEPHRLSSSRQRPPLPGTEHLTLCSAHRVDAAGNDLVFVPGKDRGPGEYLVPLADGQYRQPKSPIHARCRGCQVRCGLTAHGMMEKRTSAEPSLGESRTITHTPFPSPDIQWFNVICGDSRDLVQSLDQVHCVLTSPPSYGTGAPEGSPLDIGREGDPREYVTTLCDILDAIRLHPEGSLWVNLRDTREKRALLAIPESFVHEMGSRGWRLLDRVVWAKSALYPDGTVRGGSLSETGLWRLSDDGFEYLLRFSRTDRPWADGRAVRIPEPKSKADRYLPADRMILPTAIDGHTPPGVWVFGPGRGGPATLAPIPEDVCEIPIAMTCPLWVNPDGSLPRRVGPMAGPSGLQRADWPNIDEKAKPGIVLDPFCGVGTIGVVALRLGRSFVGCELDDRHCVSARGRLGGTSRRLSGDECVTDPSSVPGEITFDRTHSQHVSGVS